MWNVIKAWKLKFYNLQRIWLYGNLLSLLDLMSFITNISPEVRLCIAMATNNKKYGLYE